jgi:hypothetical protein
MRRALLLIPFMFALAGCDAPRRLDAANGVRAFVLAAESGDRKAFEAAIDRPRLRRSLKAQLRGAMAADPGMLARLDTPEGERAIDAMIAPEAFRLGFNKLGGLQAKAPGAAELALALKMEGPDRACLRESPTARRCVLTFERIGGTWKLVEVSPTEMRVDRRASDTARA